MVINLVPPSECDFFQHRNCNKCVPVYQNGRSHSILIMMTFWSPVKNGQIFIVVEDVDRPKKKVLAAGYADILLVNSNGYKQLNTKSFQMILCNFHRGYI
ncbi:hypothetical protein WA026_010972 [Henosepilachna vigintioctopunctata]|uniref:Uncharacterized protein n=1 Tax=Henosepilachna vigintioctopunctata TaxID=420089 RepID=A0AAW1V0V4_9CUCU